MLKQVFLSRYMHIASEDSFGQCQSHQKDEHVSGVDTKFTNKHGMQTVIPERQLYAIFA